MRIGRYLSITLMIVCGVARADEPAPSPAPISLDAIMAQLEAMKQDLAAQRRELDEQRTSLAAQRRELTAQRELAESALTADTSVKEPTLRLYGFADAGLQKAFVNDDSPIRAGLPTSSTTFVMGNINLYLDALPSPDWNALVEIHFTNLPNGADQAGTALTPYTRTNTRVFDSTSPAGGVSQIKLGGLSLERAQITWQRFREFQVRIGAILTPFGIWNLDHGTPTLISLMLPMFENSEMFPTHQVGLELKGSHRWSTTELGYHLYVTNGRTPGEVSLSEDNKLLGGRLLFTFTRPYRLTLGASGFVARGLDQARYLTSLAPLETRITTTIQYDEQAFGLDLSLDARGVRLRSEFTWRRVEYVNGKRALSWGEPGVYDPNHVDWDYYVLLAYRLPWWGIEPYIYCELYDYRNPVSDGFLISSVGVNVHFTESAQLKLQFADNRAIANVDSFTFAKGVASGYDMLALRLVLAF